MSAFIDHQRGRFAVELICRTLGVSVSSYYQRATGERSTRALEDERLTGRLVGGSADHADVTFVCGCSSPPPSLRSVTAIALEIFGRGV